MLQRHIDCRVFLQTRGIELSHTVVVYRWSRAASAKALPEGSFWYACRSAASTSEGFSSCASCGLSSGSVLHVQCKIWLHAWPTLCCVRLTLTSTLRTSTSLSLHVEDRDELVFALADVTHQVGPSAHPCGGSQVVSCVSVFLSHHSHSKVICPPRIPSSCSQQSVAT